MSFFHIKRKKMRKILNLSPKTKEKIGFLLVFCIVFIGFRFAGKIVLPFVVAFVLALFVRKIADKLKSFTGLSTRAGGFACLVLVYLLCMAALFLAARFLIRELGDFIEILPNIYNEKIQPKLNEIFLKISNISEPNSVFYELSKQIFNSLADFAKNISAKALQLVANIVLSLPEILFSVFVCVLASFFICFDYQKLKEYFLSRLTPKTVVRIENIKRIIKNTVLKMLWCTGLLFAVTFAQLFIGLKLFNVKHAFVLSFVIALTDALPMLGVGTVLVPWSAACFAMGNLPLGVGLAALFLIITVVRNILEPKIIGKKMGIHPLVSLAVMYIGICIGGILTAILLLFLIVIMKYLNNENGFI